MGPLRDSIMHCLMRWGVRVAIALTLVLVAFTSSGFAHSVTTIYSFDCTNGLHDGCAPSSVIEKDGVLYGTTSYGGDGTGTAFALTQPASPGAPWNQTVIYRFNRVKDGYPGGSLVAGPGPGLTLYGTRSSSSSLGMIFELQPQGDIGSPWTLTALPIPSYLTSNTCFTEINNNWCRGPSGLIVDSKGTLYGIVAGCYDACGEVFSLTPPTTLGGPWTENVLHFFSGSRKDGGLPSFLLLGPDGVIYGTSPTGGDHNNGVVFMLVPPAVEGGAWTEQILHVFTGHADGAYPLPYLVADKDGRLFGASSGIIGQNSNGSIYELVPPATSADFWTEQTIWALYQAPTAGQYANPLLTLANGSLYGTTSGSPGILFQLTPPAALDAPWTAASLLSPPPDCDTASVPVPGSGLVLYGITGYGGAYNGGSVCAVTP